MALPKTAIIFAAILLVSKAQSGFYWRYYMGDFPSDALQAGTDDKGKPIYIGQGVHDTPLPGTFRPGEKKLFYEYGNKEHPTMENVQILCSLYPKRFKWVKTSQGTSASSIEINGTTLIPAGQDGPRYLVVGRVNLSEQEIVVGKVLKFNGKLDDIWIAKNGVGLRQNTYEVLVYDPHIDAKEHIVCPQIPITVNLYN